MRASARSSLQRIGINRGENKDEVSGVTACRGYAKGTARIILFKGLAAFAKDAERFHSGDVLITTMTQPEMVPLMAKASAIVTDQGGLTSHAAVVARELEKPCVIRTYEATVVFKDGDLVEVNADKGVVRKIKP
ncbi:hypothetical protein HZB01_00665 [Candidatus Woesearchaeota archaeon]|nr:hypothetical protein [Candidatus Woesearchaeota archaeon]